MWIREEIQSLSRSLTLSGGKKDLTRIEDLGEYLHELEESSEEESSSDFLSNEEEPSFSTDFDNELPSLPEESESENNFSTDYSSGEFSSEFSSEFETEPNEAEEANFSSDDFLTQSESESALEESSWELEEEPKEETKFEEPSLDNDLFSEAEQEPEIEERPTAVFTPPPAMEREYKAPETFSDVRTFSESSSFTTTATEANPSFSVLLKEIRFLEDVTDILALLKEFNLLNGTEEQTKERLMRGSFLIPRVSEYVAIFLAHKLRRFDIDIQLGFSDEIHPPKHQEKPELGIVSKHNLYQNQGHHFQFEDSKLDINQIIVAATPSLEGYQVIRYLGVASEHQVVDSEVIMDEESVEVPKHYKELASRLKAHALKSNANAVLGLNYQLTPLPSEFGIGGNKYRLTCTGNLVWVNRI